MPTRLKATRFWIAVLLGLGLALATVTVAPGQGEATASIRAVPASAI